MKVKSPDPRAVFLLATLKHKRGGGEFSHTETLCELVVENLRENGVRSEIVTLVEYDIPPGTKSNMGKGDEWPGILKKILASDIIVFTTPNNPTGNEVPFDAILAVTEAHPETLVLVDEAYSDFAGTTLLPAGRGYAEVSGEKGYMKVDAHFDNLQPAMKFGPEYLTYVLWAITP